MKNRSVLSALAISATFHLLAQPTISAFEMSPLAGESYVTYNCNWVDPGASGANVTFDFSGLVKTDTTFVAYTGGNAAYPGSNLTASYTTYGQTDQIFINASVNGLSYVGMFLENVVSVLYQDEMELHTYLLTYNATNTDYFHATFAPWERFGTITTTADAYGTLITPEGTFTNVLRVHYLQNYTDSSSFSEIDFVSDVYAWYKEGIHYPVASVTYYTTPQGGFTQRANYLETTTLGLTEEEKTSLSIYPNPASDKATICLKSNETLKTLALTDINGRAIDLAYTASSTEVSLDLHNLNAGIYLIKLQYQSGEIGLGKIQVN